MSFAAAPSCKSLDLICFSDTHTHTHRLVEREKARWVDHTDEERLANEGLLPSLHEAKERVPCVFSVRVKHTHNLSLANCPTKDNNLSANLQPCGVEIFCAAFKRKQQSTIVFELSSSFLKFEERN